MSLPFGTIVPSQLPILPRTAVPPVVAKTAPVVDTEVRPAGVPVGVGTGDCCTACAGSVGRRMGVLVCYDGQAVMLNDYPTDGGPWVPAFTAAGSLVWVNAGGL